MSLHKSSRRFLLLAVSSLDAVAHKCICGKASSINRTILLASTRHWASNADYKKNTEYINRNPRNLELMNLANKREGWTYQYPRKDYYNKLFFETTGRHITGYVEHWSGKTVVSASTKEWPIRQQLYSTTDILAAETVGKVLAERCLQGGLTNVHYQQEENDSKKLKVFLDAMTTGDIELSEPERIRPDITPGTDYDNLQGNRYAEKKKWKDDVQILS